MKIFGFILLIGLLTAGCGKKTRVYTCKEGTVVTAVVDRLNIAPPVMAPPRQTAPALYRDPSSVVLDAQDVLARAARDRASTH